MTLWGYIISSTQGSPARLAAFGALCIGGTWLIGEAFARSTTSGFDPKKQKAQMDEMSYDNRVSFCVCQAGPSIGCCATPHRSSLAGLARRGWRLRSSNG